MTSSRQGLVKSAAALCVVLLCVAALVAWLNVRGEGSLVETAATPITPAAIQRGAYLARAGNCKSCHTVPGGADYAGGRRIDTPFGSIVSSNITPDAQTGLGSWSSAAFWRAMHHGRSKDGRLLYPAFPYPNFTTVSREDSDALYAFLRSVPPAVKANEAHALRFPYDTQAALAVWRALFFRSAAFEPDAKQSAAWNRGKYLVQGLGHCAACHSGRNFLGGSGASAEFGGSLMPDGAWYAPSLADPGEAGLQQAAHDTAVQLLRDGVSGSASVAGPMAEVVAGSTQHLAPADLDAMARYLAALPVQKQPRVEFKSADFDTLTRGKRLYAQHCAACHGERGEGVPGIYTALAGNRAVTLAVPSNLVQVIRQGGFAPSTPGNPQPFGMPPFKQVLSNEDIAAVATFIRQSWGNAAAPVSALEVMRAP
ncbi:c-type cytochrome [Burkholderiaceae bacterium UC74_6]